MIGLRDLWIFPKIQFFWKDFFPKTSQKSFEEFSKNFRPRSHPSSRGVRSVRLPGRCGTGLAEVLRQWGKEGFKELEDLKRRILWIFFSPTLRGSETQCCPLWLRICCLPFWFPFWAALATAVALFLFWFLCFNAFGRCYELVFQACLPLWFCDVHLWILSAASAILFHPALIASRTSKVAFCPCCCWISISLDPC